MYAHTHTQQTDRQKDTHTHTHTHTHIRCVWMMMRETIVRHRSPLKVLVIDCGVRVLVMVVWTLEIWLLLLWMV
jgi:hypothetical protein